MITPMTSPPPSSTASATAPISPTWPPPYTRPRPAAGDRRAESLGVLDELGRRARRWTRRTPRLGPAPPARGSGRRSIHGRPLPLGNVAPWTHRTPPRPLGRGRRGRPRRRRDRRGRRGASNETGGPDAQQVLAYDLAHAASAAATARALLDYGAKGDTEARITCAFVADMVHDLVTPARRPRGAVGRRSGAPGAGPRLPRHVPRSRASSPASPSRPDPATSTTTWSWSRTRSVRSPPTSSPRRPSTSTGTTATSPRTSSPGLAEIGAFGLSVPAEYGGYNEGGDGEYLAMVVATEELSRASLGIGGSLITRPEILTRALVKGGTEEQKLHWLPQAGDGRDDGRRRRHRAGLRQRRRRGQGRRHAGRGSRRRAGLRHQRRQDVVHVRRPRRRADAAGTHRSRPLQGPSRPEPVHRPQAARRRPRLPVHPGGRRRRAHRADGGPPDRHDRLPRHAQLRDRHRGLVGPGRPPDRRRGRARPGLLLSRWAGSRTAGCRRRRGPSA